MPEPYSGSSSRSNDFHWRIETGMGSSLYQLENERKMACCGETTTYQYSRIESCLLGSWSPGEIQILSDCITEYGQRYFCGLQQPQGQNTFSSTFPTHSRSVELVYSERYYCVSIPHPREIEQSGRSRISSICWQQRLDARPQHHQILSETLSNRSFCLKANVPTPDVHQLEARPRTVPLRRLQSELEQAEGFCLTTLQYDLKSSQQNSYRQNGNCSSSPDLASPTVVAPAPSTSHTAASFASGLTSPPNRPCRTTESSFNASSTSHESIQYLTQRYQAQGPPADVAKLLTAATRSSTQKTYESRWKRWRSWCCPRQIIPVSVSLKDILTFL